MTDLTTRRIPEPREPDPPPDAGPFQEAEPVSAVSGVPLSRLLVMARLSAAQALEIGATVRAAAAGGDGNGDDQLVVDPVVTADGRVVLPSVAGPRRSLDAVLADIAAAVPLPAPGSDRAPAIDHTAVRAELAALVRAVGEPRAGAPASAPSARWVEPAGPGSRSAARRIGAWLLSILVLAAVVVAEIVFLRGHIAADVGLLLDAGRGGQQPATPSAPAGGPLVAPAPAAAGSVAAVDLRPLERCAPGAACTVRLLVRLVPSSGPQVVTWTYQVVDRCTGTSVIAPGGTVDVPPGGDRAIAVRVVALPSSDAVAVVAVTSTPAAAASPALSVGSCRAAGQGG